MTLHSESFWDDQTDSPDLDELPVEDLEVAEDQDELGEAGKNLN